jgi:chorismate mutase
VAPETVLLAFEQADESSVMLRLAGREGGRSKLRILPDRDTLSQVQLRTEAGEAVAASKGEQGWEFDAPQRQTLVLSWAHAGGKEGTTKSRRRVHAEPV